MSFVEFLKELLEISRSDSKNVRDADAFLPEAKQWGIIKGNSLMIVAEEAAAIEAIRLQMK